MEQLASASGSSAVGKFWPEPRGGSNLEETLADIMLIAIAWLISVELKLCSN